MFCIVSGKYSFLLVAAVIHEKAGFKILATFYANILIGVKKRAIAQRERFMSIVGSSSSSSVTDATTDAIVHH